MDIYILVGGFKHFLFSIIYGIILPIDFHLFQRGSNHQPDNTSLMIFTRISAVWLGFSHPKMDVAVSSHFHWGLPWGASWVPKGPGSGAIGHNVTSNHQGSTLW